MMETSSRQDFNLRHSIQPYVGLAVILSGVTLLDFSAVYRSHDTSFLWVAPCMWGLFGLMIVTSGGLGYRIRLQRDTVVQLGYRGRFISIPISQIDRIEMEVSLRAKRESDPTVNRPFRRIVIFPKTDPEMYIDVSLKHFKGDDIRELMRRIRAQRPDLSFPNNWV